MDIEAWIADYAAYLKTHGYAARTRSMRLKHLRALEQFVTQRAMKALSPHLAQHAR